MRQVTLDRLFEERIKNAVYRRHPEGDRIAAWGYRMVEWPLESESNLAEVIPEREGFWYSNGGTTIDVDGDGMDEVVVGRSEIDERTTTELLLYLESPQDWSEHVIARLEHGRVGAPHDIQPFDVETISGERRHGVVVSIDRRQLMWFEIPEDPTEPWPRHDIVTLPENRQSGLTLGDVTGDGRPELVSGMFWIEMPDDPRDDAWTAHRFGTWDEDNWGGMAKHVVGDFDGDGLADIAVAEAEIPGARLGIFHRTDPSGEALWEPAVVDTGLYCPHSLVGADLNEDDQLDLVVGEMTAGGWGVEMNDNPTIAAYLNEGDGRFEPTAISEGDGIHEMGAVDLPEGAWLLYGADEIQPQTYDGMITHVGYWVVEPAR